MNYNNVQKKHKRLEKFKSLVSRCKVNTPPSNEQIANNNTAKLEEFSKGLMEVNHINKDMLLQSIDSMSINIKMVRKRKIMDEKVADSILKSMPSIKKQILQDGMPEILNSEIYPVQVVKRLILQRVPQAAEHLDIESNLADYANGDLKAYVLQQYYLLQNSLYQLHNILLDKAEENVKTLLPLEFSGSIVQATSMAHYLLSYEDSINNTLIRIANMMDLANTGPYGAYHGAGTSFNINRDMINRNMGFESSDQNANFSISNRMYASDFLYVCSAIASDLAKLSSDLIDWSAQPKGYIQFSPEVLNNDPLQLERQDYAALELVRGASAVINSNLNAVISLQNRNNYSAELEMISNYIVSSTVKVQNAIKIIVAAVNDMQINKSRTKEMSIVDHSLANDLYEWLNINTEMKPMECKEIVGQIVNHSIESGKKLSLITLEELQEYCQYITKDVYSTLIASRSVIGRRSSGASNPVQVRKAIRQGKRVLNNQI